MGRQIIVLSSVQGRHVCIKNEMAEVVTNPRQQFSIWFQKSGGLNGGPDFVTCFHGLFSGIDRGFAKCQTICRGIDGRV